MVRQQVNAISRQIMQNNINSEELRSLLIPLPPPQMQKEIMRHVESGREKISIEGKILRGYRGPFSNCHFPFVIWRRSRR